MKAGRPRARGSRFYERSCAIVLFDGSIPCTKRHRRELGDFILVGRKRTIGVCFVGIFGKMVVRILRRIEWWVEARQ